MTTGWGIRLANAVKRGGFNPTDERLAASWRSCAVAEAPKRITKNHPENGPSDSMLDTLGVDFSYHVVVGQPVGPAVDTYHKIRARVRELRAA